MTLEQWTRARELVAGGMMQKDAAALLGVDPTQVCRAVRTKRWSPDKPKWPVEDDERLRRMCLDGMRQADMARELGRTRAAVNAACIRLGITTGRTTAWTTRERETAARLYRAGETCTSIARTLNRREGQVRSQLGRMGVLEDHRRKVSRLKSDTDAYVLRLRGLTWREILLVLDRPDTVSARSAMRQWMEHYCRRLEVPVPPVPSHKRVRPEVVAQEKARRAACTGGQAAYAAAQTGAASWDSRRAKGAA